MSIRKSTLSDEQFVRIRCGTDGRTYYFEAIGSMYAHPLDGDEPVHLFDFLGVDISRCVREEAIDRWFLVSRKFSLYLAPETGRVLRRWRNPWTGETLNVLHRSYDYQEFAIPPRVEVYRSADTSFVSLDINLKLANPLAIEPRFADYSPEPFVQSSDSYKFIFPTAMVDRPGSGGDSGRVTLSYYRMGPWEPWMKMKGKPGFIVLNYTGTKTDRFDELHPEIRERIENRLPLYREAPAGRLPRSIATSWSRFEEEFDAYCRGEEFPLAAPLPDAFSRTGTRTDQ
ncbi:DUF1838 family protein [Pannus brasiliensis CCIBt3594]|uniref:DUF1838 family protein n=1 Tax=Pannus brasiliensis CCIBt3594 TaxID=1427578 RepID=A0AAW9QNS3_9CHRO